eukprot:CAMPEP_0117451874 /NCGR_PEP_ID=MMETSP0759-20121206/9258_1 /TAXON_ID=63605 /ORGANISM="Percolomonas cosmopolitus, Strain WS" /LENGTH=1367 /DNA_ID=CAMNT_0005244539 /DNA_START=514 /DNA_END=4614 /DNA_ORIENTATION=-
MPSPFESYHHHHRHPRVPPADTSLSLDDAPSVNAADGPMQSELFVTDDALPRSPSISNNNRSTTTTTTNTSSMATLSSPTGDSLNHCSRTPSQATTTSSSTSETSFTDIHSPQSLSSIPPSFTESFIGIFRVHHTKAYIELPETPFDLKQYEEAEKKPKRMNPKNYSFDGGPNRKKRGSRHWKSNHSRRNQRNKNKQNGSNAPLSSADAATGANNKKGHTRENSKPSPHTTHSAESNPLPTTAAPEASPSKESFHTSISSPVKNEANVAGSSEQHHTEQSSTSGGHNTIGAQNASGSIGNRSQLTPSKDTHSIDKLSAGEVLLRKASGESHEGTNSLENVVTDTSTPRKHSPISMSASTETKNTVRMHKKISSTLQFTHQVNEATCMLHASKQNTETEPTATHHDAQHTKTTSNPDYSKGVLSSNDDFTANIEPKKTEKDESTPTISEPDATTSQPTKTTTKRKYVSQSYRERMKQKKEVSEGNHSKNSSTSSNQHHHGKRHSSHSSSHKLNLLNLHKLAHDMNLPRGSFLQDLVVPSHKERNGAMDGDIVSFALLPKTEWRTKLCHIPQDSPEEMLIPETPREHIQLTASVVQVETEKRQKQHVGYLIPSRDSTATIDECEKSCYFVPFDSKYPKFVIPIRSVEQLLEQEGYKLRLSRECKSNPAGPHTDQDESSEQNLTIKFRENPHFFSDVMFVARLGKKGDIHHTKYPAASLKQILGKPSLPTQLEAIISQNMLNGFVNFPSKVIEEVEHKFSNWSITEKDMLKRTDYRRKVRPFSVDPAGTKDCDDAFSLQRIGTDLYEVGVHIADVSHFLHPFSCVETEARFRTCSVYMVNQTFPMLPRLLSENLCSLLPGKDRFTVSLFVQMDARGNVVGTPNFVRTVVSSSCAISYDECQLILEWTTRKKERDESLFFDVSEDLPTPSANDDFFGDYASDAAASVAHTNSLGPADAVGAAALQHQRNMHGAEYKPGHSATTTTTTNTSSSFHSPSSKFSSNSEHPFSSLTFSQLHQKMKELKKSLQLYHDYSFNDLVQDIHDLHHVTMERRQRRFESGSLSFRNRNLHFNVKSDGQTHIHSEAQMDSQHMVEEVMLITNTCAAKTLMSNLPEETILRFHRPPQEKSFIRFNKFCSKFGLVLNSTLQHDLNKLLQSVSGDLQALLFFEAKQMMRTAEYACGADIFEDLGRHYALNETHYVHFTSPIRRYTDLMAQRLLLYAIKVPKPPYKLMYSVNYIRDVVSRSNLINQRAKKAEEQSEYVYLQHTGQTFRSIVHSISRNIIFLYIPDLDIASEIKVKYLPNFASKQYFKEQQYLEVSFRRPKNDRGTMHDERVINFRPLQSHNVRIVKPPHSSIMGGHVCEFEKNFPF